MNKFFFISIIFITLLSSISHSQDIVKSKFIFLPSGLSFMPLRAGIDEPRMGVLYYASTKNMKIDIGNSFDILEFNFSQNEEITVGAEFMAYAYVTNYLTYRLQIDAIDGFFGGDVIYSKKDKKGRWIGRFRYIHHSAHLVDGHWDSKTNSWLDNITPSVFGNNYGGFLFVRQSSFFNYSWRLYGGMSISTGKKTGYKILDKLAYKTGVEFAIKDVFGTFLNKDENIFTAVNFDVIGIPEYIVNQHYIIGLKFGNWNGKGISFYLSYYNGGDVFSQYFQKRVSRFGIGFTFDFI